MTTTSLFVIAYVKQLRGTGGSFRILLPFFSEHLNSAIFNSFHNWVEFGTILEGLSTPLLASYLKNQRVNNYPSNEVPKKMYEPKSILRS